MAPAHQDISGLFGAHLIDLHMEERGRERASKRVSELERARES